MVSGHPLEPKMEPLEEDEEDKLTATVKAVRGLSSAKDKISFLQKNEPLVRRAATEQVGEFGDNAWEDAKRTLPQIDAFMKRRDLATEEKLAALKEAANPERMTMGQAVALSIMQLGSLALGAGIGAAAGGGEGALAGATVGGEAGIRHTQPLRDLYKSQADRQQKVALKQAELAYEGEKFYGGLAGEALKEHIKTSGDIREEELENERERIRQIGAYRRTIDATSMRADASRYRTDALAKARTISNQAKEVQREERQNEKTEEKSIKRVDKLSKELFSASRRRILGAAQDQELLIDKLEGLLEIAGKKSSGKTLQRRDLENMTYEQLVNSFNNLDKQEVAEVITVLNEVLSRGVGTDTRFEHLMPQSYKIWAKEMQQRITNTPTGVDAGKFIARVYKTLLNEKEVLKKRMAKQGSGLLQSHISLSKDPDHVNFFRRAIRNLYISSDSFGEEYEPYLIGNIGDPIPLTEDEASKLNDDDLIDFVNGGGIIINGDGSWLRPSDGLRSE